MKYYLLEVDPEDGDSVVDHRTEAYESVEEAQRDLENLHVSEGSRAVVVKVVSEYVRPDKGEWRTVRGRD